NPTSRSDWQANRSKHSEILFRRRSAGGATHSDCFVSPIRYCKRPRIEISSQSFSDSRVINCSDSLTKSGQVTRLLLKSILSEYTTVIALLLLCGLLSIITWGQQFPAGASGGRQVAETIVARGGKSGDTVLIVVRPTEEDAEFTATLQQ